MIDKYKEIVGEEVIEELYLVAKKLKGITVQNINSTPFGGGVAEILSRMVPLMRELGLDVFWDVIKADSRFFEITKKIHNTLHGVDLKISKEELDYFRQVNLENANNILRRSDIVFVHDPQPVYLVEKKKKLKNKWIWRCHIDFSSPKRDVWKFLKKIIERYDLSVFSAPSFAHSLKVRQVLIPPSIDPLSDKNKPLDPIYIEEVLRRFGIDKNRPIITQISRFDYLKDPLGVIKAYRLVKRYLDCQLVLAGGGAVDDPEGVKDFFRKERVSSYNTFSHSGFLRYLVLRESKTKNDFMVNIVTTSESSLDEEAFKSALISLRLKGKKRITSLVWTISDKFSDAVVPEKFEVFYGQDYLEEEIKGFKFRIPVFSFFQVNPFILEVFFEFIKTHLEDSKERTALDLFSGVGSLSLFLAREFSFVWAVEQDELAVKTSLVNASLNNINNVSFLNSDVKKALFLNLNLWREKIFLVFINPPRAGLSKKIIKRIKNIVPEKIIYSSCNPKSFIVDLQNFLDCYRIKLIQPFDFFPHTPHIEVLALLERR